MNMEKAVNDSDFELIFSISNREADILPKSKLNISWTIELNINDGDNDLMKNLKLFFLKESISRDDVYLVLSNNDSWRLFRMMIGIDDSSLSIGFFKKITEGLGYTMYMNLYKIKPYVKPYKFVDELVESYSDDDLNKLTKCILNDYYARMAYAKISRKYKLRDKMIKYLLFECSRTIDNHVTTPRRPTKKPAVTQDVIESMWVDRLNGFPIEKIARKYQYTMSAIHHILYTRRSSVHLRPLGWEKTCSAEKQKRLKADQERRMRDVSKDS